MANETAFKGLQIFPQNLAKQPRRQMRGNGEWIRIALILCMNTFHFNACVDRQAFYSSLVRKQEYI